MKWLIDLLRDPRLQSMHVDGPERLRLHAQMLAEKRMLREVFVEFHQVFQQCDARHFSARGNRIELGSGVCPMRDSYPDVLASDIVPSEHLDLVLDGQALSLEDDSTRVLFAQNCFHHFGDPERFFRELSRVVPSGGGAVLLEPYHGPLATFLYRRLFKTEGFDKEFPSWETPIAGPMNGANQALSYLVFVRDRARFEQLFPELEIVEISVLRNYIKYVLSGGLNFRQLLPGAMTPFISWLEWILSPVKGLLGLHHVIVLRKR